MPTLLEDVPDMAVKFAVYESLRPLHHRVFGGRQVRLRPLIRIRVLQRAASLLQNSNRGTGVLHTASSPFMVIGYWIGRLCRRKRARVVMAVAVRSRQWWRI